MTQRVTVNSGDTVTQLLKRKRGLKDHEVISWLPKVRRINPHISNLNLIHPQEKVLLPERLEETVSDAVIWQNAFEHIPPALSRNGQTMHLCIGAESIDDVAKSMFADTPNFHIKHSAKRALLIHNNPFLLTYLSTNLIPPGTMVDITPKRFSHMDHHFWNSQRPHITVAWDQLHETSKQVVQSKNRTNLVKMQQFLTGHPKYQHLMQSLKELPKYLLPKGRLAPNPLSSSPNAAARHFRKEFCLPYDKWNSARYFSTIGRRLNGKVQMLKGVGRHATWYIPAAFGLYNVVQAPAEMKMRTLFEEGFGVLGGAVGGLAYALGAYIASIFLSVSRGLSYVVMR